MKAMYRTLATTIGAMAFTALLVPAAMAQCGGYSGPKAAPSSWRSPAGHARLDRAAFRLTGQRDDGDEDDQPAIVGFWHVKFVTKDTRGIPDGTEVDAGYAQWHSDHTEIMNSGGRSPLTGDFCLGVWKQVGDRTFKLNHFAAAWDGQGAKLLGPANIREEVTVAPGGGRFAGTFTIDQRDEAGNLLAHLQGVITGTRIRVNTPSTSVF